MRVKNKTLILMIIGFFIGFSQGSVHADIIQIASTIEPISDLVRQVAGEGHEVLTILPAGVNPHTFELHPQMMKHVSSVQMVFTVGAGFDDWIRSLFQVNPDLKVVTLSTHVQLIANDPHYWLSIQNAKVMAHSIADGLIQINPAGKAIYETNLSRLEKTLDESDREIKKLFLTVSNKNIITFHDSWNYFARDFGLNIVATVEDYEDAEPTPKHLVAIHQLVQSHKIKALFSEPTVNRSLAESIARDLGLTIYHLDPLGFSAGSKTFQHLMLYNAQLIAKALAV